MSELDIPTYLDEPITLRCFKQLPGGLVALRMPAETGEFFRDKLLAQRRQLIDLPNATAGLNLDRIDAYRQHMGAPPKVVRFLGPAAFAAAQRITRTRKDHHIHGGYLVSQDVVLIKRNAKLEALNGPEVIESFAIHELAHAHRHPPTTDVVIDYTRHPLAPWRTKPQTTVTTVASGFGDDSSGKERIEEMYGELERYNFVTSPDFLNKPEGFLKPRQAQHLQKRGLLDDVSLPYWLLIRRPWGSVTAMAPEGSPEATLLDTLSNNNPDVLPQLRAFRPAPDAYDKARLYLQQLAPITIIDLDP